MADDLRPRDYSGFTPDDDDPGPHPILHPIQAYRELKALGWKLEAASCALCRFIHPDETHEQVHGR